MNPTISSSYEDNFVRHVLEIRIGGRYQLDCKIGSGTFGEVYQGRDAETGEEVALKLEHYSVAPSLVTEEVTVYQSLANKAGFPRVLWHGQHDRYNIMVLDLLGPNLEDLLSYCGGQFSLKTTLMLADQLLTRFEILHAQGYLHRDVKPENFLMGSGRQGNLVYMTDLGLASLRATTEPMTNVEKHETQTHQPRLLGTCRYASINGHQDGGRSCGDDLESLGYMLIYFLEGRLPWQGLYAKTREERYELVLQMKQTTKIDDLCSGLPIAFSAYMAYIRSLPASDTPNYRRLRQSFRDLFRKRGFCYDNVFDWTLLEYQRFQAQTAGSATRKSQQTQKRKIPVKRNNSRKCKRKRARSNQ